MEEHIIVKEGGQIISEMRDSRILFIDTEVAHWRTPNPKIATIQVLFEVEEEESTTEKCVVLDVYDNESLWKSFVEQCVLNDKIVKVFHNAKFDIGQLGGECKNYVCTLELARSLDYTVLPVENNKLFTLYIHFCRGKESQDWIELAQKKEDLQKNIDWSVRPFSSEMMEYAVNDCKYLKKIYENLKRLEETSQIKLESISQSELDYEYFRLQRILKDVQKKFNRTKNLMKERLLAKPDSSDKYELRRMTRKKKYIRASDLKDVNVDFEIFLSKQNFLNLGEESLENVIEREDHYTQLFKKKV